MSMSKCFEANLAGRVGGLWSRGSSNIFTRWSVSIKAWRSRMNEHKSLVRMGPCEYANRVAFDKSNSFGNRTLFQTIKRGFFFQNCRSWCLHNNTLSESPGVIFFGTAKNVSFFSRVLLDRKIPRNWNCKLARIVWRRISYIMLRAFLILMYCTENCLVNSRQLRYPPQFQGTWYNSHTGVRIHKIPEQIFCACGFPRESVRWS